jgi:nicotinamidase-related amidase
MNEPGLLIEPDRTALILQDLQDDVISDGGAMSASGSPQHAKEQDIVRNAKRLVHVCRQAGIPILHVWFIAESNARGLKINAPAFEAVKRTNAHIRGTWGAAPVDGLEPLEGDLVIEKMRMSAWEGTRLEALLQGLKRDVLIMAGAFTNMSIEHLRERAPTRGTLCLSWRTVARRLTLIGTALQSTTLFGMWRVSSDTRKFSRFSIPSLRQRMSERRIQTDTRIYTSGADWRTSADRARHRPEL